jgi:hypothetical protein
MNSSACAALVAVLAFAGPLTAHLLDDDMLVIDPVIHHLGDDETPEWEEAPSAPEDSPLQWVFEAVPNASGQVLAVRQRHVNNRWTLTLNGAELATLTKHDDYREVLYPVPAGALRKGTNVLRLVGDAPTDDITFGDVRLHLRSLRDLLDLAPVRISVTDRDSGEPLPARITLRAANGGTPTLYAGESHGEALRPGIAYTADGDARFDLARGTYDVWASRGTEWSVDQGQVVVGANDSRLALSLSHELDTTGLIAVDTHIHTLTHSGHGDASVEERMATLAGEGVELAIATDHNHNTDYREIQMSEGVSRWFTSVVGNEVTTGIGHFNAFPLDPDDEIPLHNLNDWVATVSEIRSHGAEVVILNHPRWPDHVRGPFGVTGLDHATGERASGTEFTFDAMELVNSTDEESQPEVLLDDWFCLLNRGEGVVAVGSSDSHTVRHPVGQGRTYVVSASTDVAAIDVSEICRNIVAGRCSVSMGIIADAWADERYGMGDLVPATDREVDLKLRVRAPSWVQPQAITVYVNGMAVESRRVNPMDGPHDETLNITLGLPDHDASIVMMVRGAAIDGPFWPMLNDYTIAVTNPIYADVDGDGRWSDPRTLARARHAADSAGGRATTPEHLADLDLPTAIHYLTFERERLTQEGVDRLREVASERAGANGLLRDYLDGLPR